MAANTQTLTSEINIADGNLDQQIIWYDVTSNTTGPETASWAAKEKLRQEVHRLLTPEGSVARQFVDQASRTQT